MKHPTLASSPMLATNSALDCSPLSYNTTDYLALSNNTHPKPAPPPIQHQHQPQHPKTRGATALPCTPETWSQQVDRRALQQACCRRTGRETGCSQAWHVVEGRRAGGC